MLGGYTGPGELSSSWDFKGNFQRSSSVFRVFKGTKHGKELQQRRTGVCWTQTLLGRMYRARHPHRSFIRSPVSCLNFPPRYQSCCCRKTVCIACGCGFGFSSYSILVNVLCSFMQVKLCHCCNSHSFPLHLPFISLPLLHLFSSRFFLSHTLTTVRFLRYVDTFCQVCFCYLRVGCHAMLRTTKKKKRKMPCYFNNTTKRRKLEI